MSNISGSDNEFEFVKYLNGKKILELNPMFRCLIDELFPLETDDSIISVGKNNRYGHPNDKVLENLEDSKIYRTDLDGSTMFKIKRDNLEIKTCSP